MATTTYRKEKDIERMMCKFNRQKASEKMKAIVKNKKLYEDLYNLCKEVHVFATNGHKEDAQKLIEITFAIDPQLKKIAKSSELIKALNDNVNFYILAKEIKNIYENADKGLKAVNSMKNCEKSFKKKSYLEKHYKLAHNNEKLPKYQKQLNDSMKAAKEIGLGLDVFNTLLDSSRIVGNYIPGIGALLTATLKMGSDILEGFQRLVKKVSDPSSYFLAAPEVLSEPVLEKGLDKTLNKKK